MDSRDITRDKTSRWGRISPEYTELPDPESPRTSQHHARPQIVNNNPAATSTGVPANDAETDLSLWQAMRKYPKITLYCLAVTTVIIGWGFQLVVAGAIVNLDNFKKDFGKEFEGDLIIPGYWLSLWNALPAAGGSIGSIAVGWMQDKIGRKYSLMTGTLLAAASIALITFSFLPPKQMMKQSMITAGFTIQGFAIGIIKITSITWISENAPTRLRGSAMAIFPTFTLLGQLLGLVAIFKVKDMEGREGYLSVLGSMWIFTVCPFLLSLVMPDSPSFLLRKGREAAAFKATKRLYAPKVNPHLELNKIRASIANEKSESESVPYRDLFRGTDRRRTLIVVLASGVQAMFGLDLLSNASVFLEQCGLTGGQATLFMIAGIIAGLLANGAGIYIMTRGGRRTMSVVSMGAAAVLWGGMGVSGFFDVPAAPYIAGGMMVGVLVVCGMGCWPASYAVTGETSSLKLRAATQGFAGVTGQAASILMGGVLPFIYNADSAALGAKTGFLFCGLCTIGVALLWFFLPEMKDRSQVELDHMFEIKLSAQKFRNYKMAGHEDEAMMPLTSYTK